MKRDMKNKRTRLASPSRGGGRDLYDSKKVVITGGMGFIGSNLAQALVPMGAKVVVIDALLPSYGGNRFNLAEIAGEVEFVDGDVRDFEVMKKWVADADYVFHLAAQVSYLDANEKPFDDLDLNGRGTLTVLESVKESASSARVVFASSRLVYGKIKDIPVKESHPTDPQSLYGIHKLLGEKYMGYYAHEFGMPTISLRIPNPYGPRQQMKHGKYSIVGWFLRQAMEGKTISIYGDGRQERDYLYIDDLVEGWLLAGAKGEAGEVYNVGTHERVRFAEMVDAVIEAAGQGKKELVPWPENYEKNETGDYIADTGKLAAVTGWQPRVKIRDGVKLMAEFYRENRDEYF